MPIRNLPRGLVFLTLLALVDPGRSSAAIPGQALPANTQDLKALSIEELMNVDVTSASRREEPIGSTAAAVSVITRDDIRRSGVTSLADALLLADGVAVARFNNGTWAITPRGFNQNTANKLLVMVDGVTQYSPLFSGVFWNTLDYVLEDIERIEVIRGPGAALWGANAVNGVVNIITRSSRDTNGTFAAVSGGNEDHTIAEVRVGATPASGPAWRVYGKFADRDAQKLASGGTSGDGIRHGQAGFRLDGGAPDTTNWLIKGDLFHSRDQLLDRADGEFTNGGLQARWSAWLAPASRLTLQTYFRREFRRIPGQLTHHVNTIDVDAQHAWSHRRHQLIWGGGFRLNADGTEGGTVRFDPTARTYQVANLFAQDEFAVVPNRVFATIGAKWEHNAFSGGEFQPNVRARVHLSRTQMAWGAISRAVRRPTRFEDDLVIPAPDGSILVQGNENFAAESLVALEAGYRAQPFRVLSLDIAVFHHTIDNLRSEDATPVVVFPLTIGNSLIGHAHGIETAINLQPVPAWRTHVSYTWLDTTIDRAAGSRQFSLGIPEANDPPHQFHVRSSVDLPRHVEVDALLRAVSALPDPSVPGYTELTLRAGWLPDPRVELWVAGQDLLHDQHSEFGPPLPTQVEFERAIRGGVAFRF
jgi:iron complex outermembrane receptor protein